ncbi:hypothetical protein F7Q99_05030 [Streptomyces kaniharaensis]|uniref:Uncharacterized protein n=1 Tax=Streptomyces kaniharaensis TaxID=212423 RepID=A0A6N7KMI3_9ACTN|nr:hypothetical protein [Streptomyces kaniharaensis]MQS11668.1 hypothetical protein [Streptomyces kaniharaensis]
MTNGADGVDARALYEALLDYEGAEPYTAVVAPWLDRALPEGYHKRLTTAAWHREWWEGPDRIELHWELYALSRVSDYLLYLMPDGFSAQEYLRLFTALGMTPVEDSEAAFDPFHHEIAEVEQTEDPQQPIRLTDVRWPGLMLGELLFSRAGVRVSAGAHHAQRGIADASPLYWTFRRRNRPTVDRSHGWGSNSQWRTELRLDYRTATGDHLNVAGDGAIDGRPDLHPDHPENLGPDERLLTPTERRELLRHRSLLRTPEAADALAASGPWEKDLYPWEWRLPVGES